VHRGAYDGIEESEKFQPYYRILWHNEVLICDNKGKMCNGVDSSTRTLHWPNATTLSQLDVTRTQLRESDCLSQCIWRLFAIFGAERVGSLSTGAPPSAEFRSLTSCTFAGRSMLTFRPARGRVRRHLVKLRSQYTRTELNWPEQVNSVTLIMRTSHRNTSYWLAADTAN